MVSMCTVHDGQCLKKSLVLHQSQKPEFTHAPFSPISPSPPLMHDFGAPCWKALLLMDKPMSPSSPDMTCSSVIAGPSLLEWAHPIALITFELPLGTQLGQHHEPPSESHPHVQTTIRWCREVQRSNHNCESHGRRCTRLSILDFPWCPSPYQ